MAVYFGTDGIRGIANSSLTHDIAFKCGNALTMLKRNPLVIICKDTRISGDIILYSMATGVMSGGGRVINCGILPTAGLAYITRQYKADFGVVISASHNPFEYNGIKVFSSSGVKLSEEQEEKIEELFNKINLKTGKDVGTIQRDIETQKIYSDFLLQTVKSSLKGLKIVLDCAYGASYKIAPDIFEKAGCTVIKIHTDIEKGMINDNCGSLYPQSLIKEVISSGADAGFAFDGDSDRVIACDEKGNICDGDILMYILAKSMLKEGRLKGNTVVGTSHTNMGIEKSLLNKGIKLLRADIGDKYVRELMDIKDCKLGGEQSGHIIIGDLHSTGDGILSALSVCGIMKSSEKKLSELNDSRLFPQVNLNITVKDKFMVINNEKLQNLTEECKEKLGKRGRIMVRASGTEPKIRIMAECEDLKEAQSIADKIAAAVKELSEGKYIS
jgi:phosphoglucosamine mutase